MGCGHFCVDEVMGIIAILTGAKYIIPWIKLTWANRHQKPTCCHNEEEHKSLDNPNELK
jgi:hypothetical protein